MKHSINVALAKIRFPRRSVGTRGGCERLHKTKQGYQDDTGPHDFVELCRRLNLTKQSVYLVSHKPAPITKIKPFAAVFNEYIKGFWSQIPCHDDLPLFILVFNIEIDDVSGPFARWRSQKSHKMLQKVVAKVMDNAQKQFNGMQFDPLRTITRHDLENWFYRYCSHIDFSEKLMRQGLKRIFKEHKMVDMEIVEEWLEEIVDTIDRKLASAYLRES